MNEAFGPFQPATLKKNELETSKFRPLILILVNIRKSPFFICLDHVIKHK